MLSTARTASLALLGLGCWRAYVVTGVESCDELRAEIENNNESIVIATDSITCNSGISIPEGLTVNVSGAHNTTITIGDGFDATGTSNSLFFNDGDLTLESLTISDPTEDSTSSGVRAVYNNGKLTVRKCSFDSLGIRNSDTRLEEGGAIFTSSVEDTYVENSKFDSCMAAKYGGSIYAERDGSLTVSGTEFLSSEVGVEDESEEGESGEGGGIYVTDSVELTVDNCNFSSSFADYAGSAIRCSGATISGSSFIGAETSAETGHYGAILSGAIDQSSDCSRTLSIKNTKFENCVANGAGGEGGALAIFNCDADLSEVEIDGSKGTALVFKSDDPEGTKHRLTLDVVQFNVNTEPSETFYLSGTQLGSALALVNTALEDDDESVILGKFTDVYCFGNIPYECEILYSHAEVIHSGEMKCRICDEDGEDVESEIDDDGDDDLVERIVDAEDTGKSQEVIIGLSVALGFTLLVIGALAVYKINARKNARRLMEQMRDSDL